MNTIKMLFWSFLSVTQISQAMVVEKKTTNVQIRNETGEQVTLKFEDENKLKVYYKGEHKINESYKSEKHTYMDADAESRYTRVLEPNGTFDIENFAKDQDITATLTSEKPAPLNIGKELKKVFDEPETKVKLGTRVVRLAVEIEKPSGVVAGMKSMISRSSPQKKLIAIFSTDSRTLQELKELEEGHVTIKEGYAKGVRKAGSEMDTDEVQKAAYDKLKYDKREIAPTLGAWGKLMPLILDDTIAELTEEVVYRTIGLPESATPQEFFNPILLGKAADRSTQDVRKDLLLYFGQSTFLPKNPYSQKAEDKAKVVNQMITANYGKIKTT